MANGSDSCPLWLLWVESLNLIRTPAQSNLLHFNLYPIPMWIYIWSKLDWARVLIKLYLYIFTWEYDKRLKWSKLDWARVLIKLRDSTHNHRGQESLPFAIFIFNHLSLQDIRFRFKIHPFHLPSRTSVWRC